MDKPERNESGGLELTPVAYPEYRLEEWLAIGRPQEAVLVLEGEGDFDEHYAALSQVHAVIIEFGVFMDGRGFSHARKLRELGFEGELLAAGEVLPDQWQFLQRCGFSGLRDPQIADVAADLQRFSEAYQTDTLQTQPLFRRRASQ